MINKAMWHPTPSYFCGAFSSPVAGGAALWDGDTPIGLIAMIDPRVENPGFEVDDPQDVANLWRLMIDQNHQRKGYGRLAINIAYAQARVWGFSKFLTSCLPGVHTPQAF